MLALADFCLFGAMSQGPDAWGSAPEDFVRNLMGAVVAYRNLAMLAADGEFHAQLGERVLGMAACAGEEPDFTLRLFRQN
jgi:hypothetical protein